MKNQEIANIFKRLGSLLEVQGENVFKIRAYYKASENISALSEDISVVRAENRLSAIPGIGKAIEEKIGEYLDHGRISAYEKLIKEVPETIFDVMSVPSVGPKKAKLFYDKLKIVDLAGLKKAAESGRLAELDKIREKTVEKILEGISIVQAGRERMNMGAARMVAGRFIDALKTMKEVKRIEFAGSLRRGRETVGDIDILVASKKPKPIMDAFVGFDFVKNVNAHGETKSSVVSDNNVQVDLRVIDPDQYGAALLYFTGSKEFNIRIRQIAQKNNLKINEYGVFREGKKEICVASKTEKECLKALGLPMIAPELREDMGEARLFSGEKLPVLIELGDLKGEVHVHSTYSDGKHSVEDMAKEAQSRGYQYLAVSDHSVKLTVANGLSAQRLAEKQKEIALLNKKFTNFRILCGSEVEIDTDGNLDYNEKILSGLDIVVAAVHTRFDLSAEKQTSRLVNACRNKHVNILAHPFGVHIGKREPYNINFKEVCQAAVDHNVFLEINAFPVRLDLSSAHIYFARQMGVKFVINTDAHRREHFDHIHNGIALARRGWLEKQDVLNTSNWDEVLTLIQKR